MSIPSRNCASTLWMTYSTIWRLWKLTTPELDALSAHPLTQQRPQYAMNQPPMAGAMFSRTDFIQDANAERLELEDYDMKVYKASAQMADALMAELRGMKIPFFVLQKGLIHDSDTSENVSQHYNTDGAADARPSKLNNSDLADLQRRMLGLLEDLCKE